MSLLRQANGRFVSVLALSRAAEVSWSVAKRLIDEYHSGCSTYSNEVRCRKEYPGLMIGIMHEQECYMLWLYFEDPFRTDNNYLNLFFFKLGVNLSKPFILQWFKDRFET